MVRKAGFERQGPSHGTPGAELLGISPDPSERQVPASLVLGQLLREGEDGSGDIDENVLEAIIPNFRDQLRHQINATSAEISRINDEIIKMITAPGNEISQALRERMVKKTKEGLQPLHKFDPAVDGSLLAEVKALCAKNPKLRDAFFQLYTLVLMRSDLVKKENALAS